MGYSREMDSKIEILEVKKKKKKNHSVCLVTGEEAGVENFNKRAVEVG